MLNRTTQNSSPGDATHFVQYQFPEVRLKDILSRTQKNTKEMTGPIGGAPSSRGSCLYSRSMTTTAGPKASTNLQALPYEYLLFLRSQLHGLTGYQLNPVHSHGPQELRECKERTPVHEHHLQGFIFQLSSYLPTPLMRLQV
eukprot:GHVU01043753.1.p1 GENE.GHVU01043753.1~~GHVU01043753.1.p1  ORF type:complete len:142 (-),score=7.89 GHVU01043753.1:1234-1659(-)